MTAETAEFRTEVLDLGGLRYATQKNVVEAVLGRRPGVAEVEANPASLTATVTFDTAAVTLEDLRAWISDCGLHCAGYSVPEHICDPLTGDAPTPHDAHPAHTTHAVHEVDAVHEGHAVDAVHEGHGGHDHHGGDSAAMAAMAADMRNRFVVALVFALIITLYSHIGMEILGLDPPVPFGLRNDVWQLQLSLPVIFWCSSIFFRGAVSALRARTLDMMVLVAVGIGTGWLYSTVVTLTGADSDVFFEAATMLAAFVLLGHWFEMRARGGANDAIRTLLNLAPAMALVERDGEAVEVPTGEVRVGDRLVIRPGSKVPVDAVVDDGESEVDESMVTGESLPVHKQPGSNLIGATINRNGVLHATATGVGSDTALAQIVKLVQEAQNSKAPGQRLADRAAFWLVFVALIGGLMTFLAWTVFSDIAADEALLYAITVVVITCPDALGLATPTAIMVGTGLGAKRGVLFKNATALETAARIDTVVMDKTGTLTKGEPEVTDVVADGIGEGELLSLVAAVEKESEHPLAAAIVRYAAERGAAAAPLTGFRNVPGHGATATVAGRRVAVGNRKLMVEDNVDFPAALMARRDELASTGRTAVLVAVDGRGVGVIALADAARETSAQAVRDLHDMGVRVVMLSGDNQATATRIADQLGIDTAIAEVLPGDKAAKIAGKVKGVKTVVN
ncbi:MAG: heavy metal translocating P-type ATPase, partial [Dehalococcoidia bacterium]|nr:heavy metal translocating P-type ATPase [Dehalococcoidia bacterium]